MVSQVNVCESGEWNGATSSGQGACKEEKGVNVYARYSNVSRSPSLRRRYSCSMRLSMFRWGGWVREER